MKVELWSVFSIGIFIAVVTPVYWFMSGDPTGTVALAMSALLGFLIVFYLAVVAKQIPLRPEDNKMGEIAEGAGELGFFPPFSWWPFVASCAIGVLVLGIVFGWWLFLIGVAFGAYAVWGWLFEYYRGIHAH